MTAFLSAIRGEAVLTDGSQPLLLLTPNSILPIKEGDILPDAGDWTSFSAHTAEEIQQELARRTLAERVFTLFLPVFDESIPGQLRSAIAREIEELIATSRESLQLASRRYHSAPFPSMEVLKGAIDLASDAQAPLLEEFLRRLYGRQPHITGVAAAWAQMPASAFPAGFNLEAARSHLVQAGTFERFVEALEEGRLANDFAEREAHHPAAKSIPGIHQGLVKWASLMPEWNPGEKSPERKIGTLELDGELDGGIKHYLREIGKIALLTPEQEIELATRIKKGSKLARDHMMRANLRLVVKIAEDYANYGVSLLDLISEGNIGLMKAVERFDPSKGGRLSTYAAWWIKQSIKRALANQSKTIRLPVHMVDKISKMRRVAMSMSEDLGREPTDDELSEKLAQLKAASLRPASLDAPISDDGSTEFGETIGGERAQTPPEILFQRNMHNQFDGLLDVLDERERKIIDARFGLLGQKPKTLEEVGQKFGVTRERIRQLQNIALKKLRRALQKKEDPGPKPLKGAKDRKPGKLEAILAALGGAEFDDDLGDDFGSIF